MPDNNVVRVLLAVGRPAGLYTLPTEKPFEVRVSFNFLPLPVRHLSLAIWRRAQVVLIISIQALRDGGRQVEPKRPSRVKVSRDRVFGRETRPCGALLVPDSGLS